jgi:lipid-A-disaccharide synthase
MEASVMIVAGEASGDQHAARLVRRLRARSPGIAFHGMGGRALREAGVELLVDSTELAVVGVVEVLRHYPRLKAALERLRQTLRERRPDLLVLVDYPDFNLRLARTAKALGIPVLYYVSPQVWAWRRGRVETIARLVDHMAVIFPFEVEIYRAAGVPVTFTGHPLAETVRPDRDAADTLRRWGLEPGRRTVALLPGSRRSEIRRLLVPALEAARRLHRRDPSLQFILPLAPGLDEAALAPWLADRGLPLALAREDTVNAVAASAAALTASGTATLVVGLLGTPLVIYYKVAWPTYLLGRLLVRGVRHIGMVNVLAGRAIAPEFIQHEARPERLADALWELLERPEAAATMRRELADLRGLLQRPPSGPDVEDIALELLGA